MQENNNQSYKPKDNNAGHKNPEFNPEQKTKNQLHFGSRIAIKQVQDGVQRIRQELSKIIVGQEEFIELLLVGMFSNGHLLIEGVPGVAKTVTAKLLAKTMKVGFSRIQFTPDLMPADILGTSIFNAKTTDFEFKAGPIFSNLILIDEINRAPAKTQAALFEVMAEKQITVDNHTYTMQDPFLVLATQNPIEQEGTYRLPEAQLDRFLLKIQVTYPSLAEEIKIIGTSHQRENKKPEDLVNAIFDAQQIQNIQQIVHQVLVEEHLIEYIAKIVHATRNHPFLYLGASPRASLAILQASKAFAAIQGRDFVIPEDVQRLATPALVHRISVSPEKEMEGISAEQIIQQIIQSLEIPR